MTCKHPSCKNENSKYNPFFCDEHLNRGPSKSFLEEMTKFFHDEYERLAPMFGYETRTDTKVFDSESPNGELMLATVSSVFKRFVEVAGERMEARMYSKFMKDSPAKYINEGLREAQSIISNLLDK